MIWACSAVTTTEQISLNGKPIKKLVITQNAKKEKPAEGIRVLSGPTELNLINELLGKQSRD